MSGLTCEVCGAQGLEQGTACRECGASPQWQDFFNAIQVADEQFAGLFTQGLLGPTQLERVNEVLSRMRLQWSEQARRGEQPPADSGLSAPAKCRQCGRPVGEAQSYCAICGGATGAKADRLRYMDFALDLFARHIAAGMTVDAAQRCTAELQARISAPEEELKGPAVAPTQEQPAASRVGGRRTLVEILLDPQSIRWLLASGGALLAVGLVIWLSSLGVFKNAMVVAAAMGVGTLGTLAGGGAMIRYTRHSLAGRSLALLGCLVMPLNLWFYNSNHLLTLDGHLWLAAMVCCVLYAAAAYVLEDPLFVSVLLGGITMTGMLVLADLHRLAEISAPATMLIVLGLISLHAERAFAENDGPFSRRRFGMACFRSAQALIGLGLLLILGSQLSAWALTIGLNFHETAALASNRFLALGLVLAGGYGFLYSSFISRRRIYGYFSAICLLWAELLGIQIGHLANHPPVLLSALALTSLAMNIAAWLMSRRADDQATPRANPLAPLGMGLASIAMAMGTLLYLRATISGAIEIWPFTVTWSFIGAMALTALSSRIAASLNARSPSGLSATYHVLAAGATFIGVAGLLPLIGLQTWPTQAPALMAIPLIYLLASRFYKEGPAKSALPAIAGAATVIVTFCGLIAAGSQWIDPRVGQRADLWLAAFCVESALFFAITAVMTRARFNVYLSAAMLCGMIYQLLGFWQLPPQSCNVALAMAGVVGLIVARITGNDNRSNDSIEKSLFVCANGLISLPMAAVFLIGLSRLALGQADLSMLAAPAALSLLALLSAALVTASSGRRWYFSLTIGQVAVCLLTLEQYSHLSFPRKAEAFAMLAGLTLLAIGYGLWYRDQDGRSDSAGICLLFGALLAGLPPAIFALINRFGFEVSFTDELALVTIAVLMFLTGTMCRIRATTLIGGGLLVTHLITLIVFTGMKAQLAVGAYVAIGGAALFVIGLLLSVYRDRLLTLPQRIKHHEGVFRVLAWR